MATLKPLARAAARARCCPCPDGNFELIDDSYNANPARRCAPPSRCCSRPTLGKEGRRIAVLGDMLELGDQDAATHHAKLAEPIESAGIDLVYTCGPNMTLPA